MEEKLVDDSKQPSKGACICTCVISLPYSFWRKNSTTEPMKPEQNKIQVEEKVMMEERKKKKEMKVEVQQEEKVITPRSVNSSVEKPATPTASTELKAPLLENAHEPAVAQVQQKKVNYINPEDGKNTNVQHSVDWKKVGAERARISETKINYENYSNVGAPVQRDNSRMLVQAHQQQSATDQVTLWKSVRAAGDLENRPGMLRQGGKMHHSELAGTRAAHGRSASTPNPTPAMQTFMNSLSQYSGQSRESEDSVSRKFDFLPLVEGAEVESESGIAALDSSKPKINYGRRLSREEHKDHHIEEDSALKVEKTSARQNILAVYSNDKADDTSGNRSSIDKLKKTGESLRVSISNALSSPFQRSPRGDIKRMEKKMKKKKKKQKELKRSRSF